MRKHNLNGFSDLFHFIKIIVYFIILCYLADHGVHSCRETINANNHYSITNYLPYSYQRNKVAVMGSIQIKNYCYLTTHTLSISYPMMNDNIDYINIYILFLIKWNIDYIYDYIYI